MAFVIGLAFIVVLIFLMVRFADSNRYRRMTDEEFEAESKRAASLAGPITTFQKLIDPGHHVEYVQEQKEEKPQVSQSGDPPKPGTKFET